MTALASIARCTSATAVITAGLLTIAGCFSDKLQTTNEIPKDQAAQQLNATFVSPRVPVTFTPLAATVSTTNWGSEARTITAAFTAPREAFEDFMKTIGTQGEPTWMKDTSVNCPTDSPALPAPVEYASPDPLLLDWYDRDVFLRCGGIESWRIAATEFIDTGRSAGLIFMQPSGDPANPDQVTTLIGTTIA